MFNTIYAVSTFMESSTEDRTSLSRRPRVSVQQQWANFAEEQMFHFIQASPLKNFITNLAPDFYGNLSPFLINEIIRLSNPIDGCRMALQTILECMKDICKEAIHKILDENNDFKTKQSITLLCESLPIPSVSLKDIDLNDELRDRTPTQIQDILINDRHRGWLPHYIQAGVHTINVFTIKIGPGVTKATPDTGRYVVSVLMPLHAQAYHLSAREETHSQSYEELNHLYRKTLIALNSHKRMAADDLVGTGNKRTVQEEATLLAGQIQEKELKMMRMRNDELDIQVAVLTRQVEEMAEALSVPDEKRLAALNHTIYVLTDQLQASRMRNLKLTTRLDQHGITSEITAATDKLFNPREAIEQAKKRKIDTHQVARKVLNKRNTPSATSSSYDDDEEESESSFSNESSPHTSMEEEEEEEEAEEDDEDEDDEEVSMS